VKIKLITVVCVVFLSATLSNFSYAESKRQLVAGLVLELGYGRAVHNYRDYVLRGEEEYRIKARDYFGSAQSRINELSQLDDISSLERQALNDLNVVVSAYIEALGKIQKGYQRSRNLMVVLNAVEAELSINDQQAIEAIGVLREGYRWSMVEKLVFSLGYGSAIDNYKNFLIKRDDKYMQLAEAWLEEGLTLVAQLKWRERKNAAKLAALKDVETVLQTYRSALPVMEKTLEPVRNTTSDIMINIAVRGADKALAVEDQPALDGLRYLLAQK